MKNIDRNCLFKVKLCAYLMLYSNNSYKYVNKNKVMGILVYDQEPTSIIQIKYKLIYMKIFKYYLLKTHGWRIRKLFLC